MNPELVLASTSPYRKALLERLGIPFRARAPLCDEDALKRPGVTPQELAELLAEAKARSLTAEEPNAVILGGDQVATIDGKILGKPGSFERALEQLELMNGRTHELITAIYLWKANQAYAHTDITRLTMRKLSSALLKRYLKADEPYDCAGSFKLEQRGITLFENIESADHTAITGVPMIALTSMLMKLGFEIP